MGAKSEMRYAAFAAREAVSKLPTHTQQVLQDFNALPKFERAAKPFGISGLFKVTADGGPSVQLLDSVTGTKRYGTLFALTKSPFFWMAVS